MKKLFIFVVLAMSVTLAIGQQMLNTEIMQMIWRSAEFQRESGITNPDLIFPGQTLTYSFTDGTTETITVQPGDNQWTVVRDKLGKLQQKHGPIVHLGGETAKSTPKEKEEKSIFQSSDFPWFFWVFIGILALVFLGWIGEKIRQSEKQKTDSSINADPTTAGSAFVPGGVSDENAVTHFKTLAERNTPKDQIVIKDKKPVFLSTPNGLIARVEYVDGTHKDLPFRNKSGFTAKVSRNGGKTFNDEHFFDFCGNPVYQEKSFGEKSGLIISEIPINFGDERPAPVEQVAPVVTPEPTQAPAITKPASESAKPQMEVDDDIATISGDIAMVSAEMLKEGNLFHKWEVKYSKDKEGKVEYMSTIFAKIDPKILAEDEAKK
jgi:hypothetical protein